MAIVKSRLFILSLLLLSLLIVPRVSAQSSDVVTDQTAERCNLAQNYLNNIQKPRDLRTRVDRLQAYRYISSRLDSFTTRLERNKQPDAVELRAQVRNLNTNIENFKNQYEDYDKARDEAVQVQDCRNNVSEFQTKLDAARLKRQDVNTSVNAIQNLLTPGIKDQLTDLYTKLLATGKSGGGSI